MLLLFGAQVIFEYERLEVGASPQAPVERFTTPSSDRAGRGRCGPTSTSLRVLYVRAVALYYADCECRPAPHGFEPRASRSLSKIGSQKRSAARAR